MRVEARWDLPLGNITTIGDGKTTVYRFVTKLDATGKVERSNHSPRTDRKRSKTFLAGQKRSTKAEPSQSVLKLDEKKNAVLAASSSVEQLMRTMK